MTNFARPLLIVWIPLRSAVKQHFSRWKRCSLLIKTCCCSYATLFIPRTLISKQFKKLYLLLPVSKPEEHY